MNELEIKKLKEVEVLYPKSFIFSGKADFSIWNTNSGTKYDYKITKADGKNYYWVYTNINGEMQYAGYLSIYNGNVAFSKGAKGKLEVDSPQIRGIFWCLKFGNSPVPLPMCMTHHGKCGKCGKKLKDVESVRRGFGPDCWKKITGM